MVKRTKRETKTLRTKTDKMREEWSTLHSGSAHPYVTKVMKLSRLRCTGHVFRIRKASNKLIIWWNLLESERLEWRGQKLKRGYCNEMELSKVYELKWPRE